MKKINSIIFKMQLSGNGVVNFDGNSQFYFLFNHCKSQFNNLTEVSDGGKGNVNYAKKTFYDKCDGSGEYDYRLKIASNCLRNAIYSKFSDIDCASDGMLDKVMLTKISSVAGWSKGYMYTMNGNEGWKKESALTITGAEENSGAKTFIEVCTKSGSKETADSLRYEETVGNTRYEAKGFINFDRLQFMPCDIINSRAAFNDVYLTKGEDGLSLLDKAYLAHYGRIPFKEGYYTYTSDTRSKYTAEHGIMVDNEFTNFLVIETLKAMVTATIRRAKAYAKVDYVDVKLNSCDFDSNENWCRLTTEDDVEKLFEGAEYQNKYEEVAKEDVLKLREENDKIIGDKKEARAKREDEKKARKNKKETAVTEESEG